MSLQEGNSYTGSSSLFNSALLPRPADLLALWRAGKIAACLDIDSALCHCTCGFTCTPGERSLHGRTCWAAELRARCALAFLATRQIALAIAHGDRLHRFIIIVQSLDDVTLHSLVTISAPLTLDLGCHLHYPIALCHRIICMSMLCIELRHRLAQHRPAAAGLRRRPKSHRTAVQCTPCPSLVDDLPSASLFIVLRVNLHGAGHTFRQGYPI